MEVEHEVLKWYDVTILNIKCLKWNKTWLYNFMFTFRPKVNGDRGEGMNRCCVHCGKKLIKDLKVELAFFAMLNA
jgi:hypothetical protein